MTDIVHLNVGGVQYCVAKSTVMKFEDTMLANLISEKWISNNGSEAPIFIDEMVKDSNIFLISIAMKRLYFQEQFLSKP